MLSPRTLLRAVVPQRQPESHSYLPKGIIMTAEHVRNRYSNRTTFCCCGARYTNHVQAAQHLMRAHAVPEAEARHRVLALVGERRKP